ncbi:unnamed protein product [Heligmosomoides polygyrus]|uniref:Secreted protein n=1 Tax=Heligmosomoides polygyrus TaxID=6339 RepID=A0A183FRX5_HELPZ|nr:unnamed protein product [Heligmosomoides polygyrus]
MGYEALERRRIHFLRAGAICSPAWLICSNFRGYHLPMALALWVMTWAEGGQTGPGAAAGGADVAVWRTAMASSRSTATVPAVDDDGVKWRRNGGQASSETRFGNVTRRGVGLAAKRAISLRGDSFFPVGDVARSSRFAWAGALADVWPESDSSG